MLKPSYKSPWYFMAFMLQPSLLTIFFSFFRKSHSSPLILNQKPFIQRAKNKKKNPFPWKECNQSMWGLLHATPLPYKIELRPTVLQFRIRKHGRKRELLPPARYRKAYMTELLPKVDARSSFSVLLLHFRKWN